MEPQFVPKRNIAVGETLYDSLLYDWERRCR